MEFVCLCKYVPHRGLSTTLGHASITGGVFLWIINNCNCSNNSFYLFNTCYTPSHLLSTMYTFSNLILRTEKRWSRLSCSRHRKYCHPKSRWKTPWLLGFLAPWPCRARSGQGPSEQTSQGRPEWFICSNHSCGTEGKPALHPPPRYPGLMDKIKSEKSERTSQEPATGKKKKTRWKYPKY